MSASNSTVPFPAPIGGVPSPGDFPPSLFFEIAYILLIPLIVLRWSRKRSRTLVIIGVTFTSFDRVVSFAIRMAQADNPNLRTVKAMVNLLQSGYCATFLALANDCLHITRVYLVHSTRGADFVPIGEDDDADVLASSEPAVQYVPDVDAIQMDEFGTLDGKKYTAQPTVVGEVERVPRTHKYGARDEPKRRKHLRIICLVLSVAFIVGALCGVVSGATYHDAMTSPSTAAITQGTRLAEAILGVIILQSTNILLLSALLMRPQRVEIKRVFYICLICCILTISPVYRLSVMSATTTSLSTSAGVDSLNGHDAKALFYGLQLFPELIAAVLLLGVNVQAIYNTGIAGDWAVRDRR